MSEDKVKEPQTETPAADEACTETPDVDTETAAENAPQDDAGKSPTGEPSDTSDETEAPDDTAAEDASEEAAEPAEPKDDGSERYMRLMAEFQNYKKRVAKEKNDIREYATEKLITELLPVLDNFERALTSNAADDPVGYAKGMELIFAQMKTELEKSGLKEVEALGEEFDPKRHNAVMTAESEEYESGFVSQVLQKGYALNDKVIRPSMVAVAK